MSGVNSKGVESKYQRLRSILRELDSVLVAFSGGVDSTLLLKAAKDALGDNVLAVTVQSEITPHKEREEAITLAKGLGIRHMIVESHELDIPEFVNNPLERCYICKKSRFGIMLEIARERGVFCVVDGENLDDQGDYRPGMRATRELGVRSPLREARLSKGEIRHLSRKLKLSTWDKPAYACLASRIPYHSPITAEKLRQIDAAEQFIRGAGLEGQVRVRHFGDTARIEVDDGEMQKLTADTLRTRVVHYFKELGFRCIMLDLEGYRVGSLNRAINEGR